jgi:hypothetical protein
MQPMRRKDGDAPMLFVIDGIDRIDDPAKVKFWAYRPGIFHSTPLLLRRLAAMFESDLRVVVDRDDIYHPTGF